MARLNIFFAALFCFGAAAEGGGFKTLQGLDFLSGRAEGGGRASARVQPFLLAQNDDLDTFNPFIDFGEFQENVAEQESIDFFQRGRALTISAIGGYEAITFNMRQIFGDSPFVFGISAGFFFDLNLALQISGFFPHQHYFSLRSSSVSFSHYGMDLKYYFNKQRLVKGASFLSPYIIFGPFYFRSSGGLDNIQRPEFAGVIPGPTDTTQPVSAPAPDLTQEERRQAETFSAFGVKAGLGLEVPLIKKSYIGIEIAYLYVDLQFEGEDLSSIDIKKVSHSTSRSFISRLQYPEAPALSGRRFYGDIVTGMVFLGLNF